MPITSHTRVYQCPKCQHEQRLYNQSDVARPLACDACGCKEMTIIASEPGMNNDLVNIFDKLMNVFRK